jgi:hypothetical protein
MAAISGGRLDQAATEILRARNPRSPTMTVTVSVFDPPQCCATGVCGSGVDPALARFAADLDWLRRQGVAVERFNLSQQPDAFAGNDLVRDELARSGTSCLPLILADGHVVSRGVYPSQAELASWAGLAPVASALALAGGCCSGPSSCC